MGGLGDMYGKTCSGDIFLEHWEIVVWEICPKRGLDTRCISSSFLNLFETCPFGRLLPEIHRLEELLGKSVKPQHGKYWRTSSFGKSLHELFGKTCWGDAFKTVCGRYLQQLYLGWWLSSKEHLFVFWWKHRKRKQCIVLIVFDKISTRASLICKVFWEILFQKSWKSCSVVEGSQLDRIFGGPPWGNRLGTDCA